jgi:hypothetical protein
MKWQLEEDIKDLTKIVSEKATQITNWNDSISKIPTTPYEWLKENIYKDAEDSAEINEEYKAWLARTKS